MNQRRGRRAHREQPRLVARATRELDRAVAPIEKGTCIPAAFESGPPLDPSADRWSAPPARARVAVIPRVVDTDGHIAQHHDDDRDRINAAWFPAMSTDRASIRWPAEGRPCRSLVLCESGSWWLALRARSHPSADRWSAPPASASVISALSAFQSDKRRKMRNRSSSSSSARRNMRSRGGRDAT